MKILLSTLVFLSAISLTPLTAMSATITSTVLEYNGNTTPGDGANQSLSLTNPGKLTIPTGFDFSAQPFASLSSITLIQITLTLQDGNTAFGDFDFNHVFLVLDGVNTGIALNGFLGGGVQTTLTLSGTPNSTTAAAILAQLADGHLVATFITDNPSETAVSTGPGTGPNQIFVGNDALNATTTLTLTGVPEPATNALLGLGAGLVLFARVRASRRNA